ncbi:unnamed protein product [Rotaria socialis]|uniref:Uncharacterized protein n=2 Tax=Rotaria socialis TaxID=392032 RepID=A0A821FJA1_9BILA|nr:unnamed protein product [Rotaria socialis]
MINSYGRSHMGSEAVDLYRKMPNNLHDEISSICVLNDSSHASLLDQAYSIFNTISRKTEQIVAIMSSFLFDEAQQLIEVYEKSNPLCSSMYMAILSGARNSRDSILSEKMYRRMKIPFPDEKEAVVSGSIRLCNIYSSLGDHEEVEDIRFNQIKELGKKFKQIYRGLK